MRLQKYMAHCGVASRRKCEEIIASGDVMVNGETITQPGYIVDENNDIILVYNSQINIKLNKHYYAFYKPPGIVATANDPQGRKTVLEYFNDIDARLYPVGRLDFNSEGLLLISDDGDFANKVTHPKFECEKAYKVIAKGNIDKKDIKKLSDGIIIDGYLTSRAKIRVLKKENNNTHMLVSIKEGRNRQIRKMIENIDAKVIFLKRIRIGCVSLGNLKSGEYRELTSEEIKYFKTLKNV